MYWDHLPQVVDWLRQDTALGCRAHLEGDHNDCGLLEWLQVYLNRLLKVNNAGRHLYQSQLVSGVP